MRILSKLITISVIPGAACALILGLMAGLERVQPDAFVSLTFAGVAWLTVAAALVALTLAVLLIASVLAAGVALLRGPSYVQWVPAGACADWKTWLGCTWSYVDRGERQRGFRLLGVEVSLSGYHR